MRGQPELQLRALWRIAKRHTALVRASKAHLALFTIGSIEEHPSAGAIRSDFE
jgi:hypothetical protein